MLRPLTTTALLCLALVCAGAPAQAAYFPGDPVDDASAVGGVDLARDGTGAVVYVKSEGGVDHVFASRFQNGVFQPPQRLDTGLAGPGSQPVVAAAPDGRLAVAFTNSGIVYGVARQPGQPFAAPVALASGSLPSIDLSIHGAGLVSLTSPEGDVRIARLDRRNNGWAVLAESADVGAANPAGVGNGRSKIAISADGVGIVTWGEAGHVWARKVFGSGISNAPQDLTVPSFGSRVSTVSELPDVDAEEDSSYAWVVYRQLFSDGGSRILARRQRGTAFEAPVAIDAGDEPATAPRIDLAPRGLGLTAMSGAASRQPMAASIDRRDAFLPIGRILSPSIVGPAAVPALGENDEGVVAAILGGLGEAPYVRLRPFIEGKPQADVTLSRAELGPVAPTAGLEAAVDRVSGVIVTWLQGGKLVAGYQDREPGNFVGYTSRRCCVAAKARLTWQPAFDLWGPIRYEILVDGKSAGVTNATTFTLPARLRGIRHRWQVRGSDVRGQFKLTESRTLIVDDLSPRQSVRFSRKGRRMSVRVRGRDVRRAGHRTSGIGGIVVSWGDGGRGARGVSKLSRSHRYRRSGTFKLTVTTRDKAGNTVVRTRNVRIG